MSAEDVKQAVDPDDTLDDDDEGEPEFKTSKKWRRHQAVERGAGSAAATIADAVAAGVADWNRRQDRSASRKKNGAVEDALKNWGKATSKAWRKSASAPEDFWDGFDRVWKGSYRKFWRL